MENEMLKPIFYDHFACPGLDDHKSLECLLKKPEGSTAQTGSGDLIRKGGSPAGKQKGGFIIEMTLFPVNRVPKISAAGGWELYVKRYMLYFF